MTGRAAIVLSWGLSSVGGTGDGGRGALGLTRFGRMEKGIVNVPYNDMACSHYSSVFLKRSSKRRLPVSNPTARRDPLNQSNVVQLASGMVRRRRGF